MTRYKHASKAAQRYFAIWRSQTAERPVNARDAACRLLGVAAVERYRSAWMLQMKNQWWAAQQSKDRAIQHVRLAREFRIGMLTLPAFPTRMEELTMRETSIPEDFLKHCMADIQATVGLLAKEAKNHEEAMAIVSELVRHAIIVAGHLIPDKDPKHVVFMLALGKRF